MDIREILKAPLDGTYAVSVEVVLFSPNHKQVCLVLESGGYKRKGLFSYYKPKAWANPGGGVHTNETPIRGAKREVTQETGFPEKMFKINPDIVEYRVEGTDQKMHYKIVLTGMIKCNPDEFPFEINPVGDTLGRKFVSIAELPSPKAQRFWKLDGFGIFPSHLDHILSNQRQALT